MGLIGFWLFAAGPAVALQLPVLHPDRELMAPGYLGDRLEIRLTAGAARAARLSQRREASLGPRTRLGVPDLDDQAAVLGAASFEPEFRGESPPPEGSRETDFTTFHIVHLADGVDLEPALARFRASKAVASADPIAVLPMSAIPNDSLWSASSWFYQPSRHDIHAPEAWDVTTGDTSVVVAVLDTGVLPYHPDLGGGVAGWSGQIWTNLPEALGTRGADDDSNGFVDDAHGWDFVDLPSNTGVPAAEDWRYQDNDPNDYAGHGTAMAGIVGALSNNRIGVTGTAWNVRIMPLRVGWSTNRDPLGLVNMSFVAQAIRYATRMGAAVINCSFATLNQSGLYEAAGAASRAGVTIVAAAGNSGQFHELADREDVIAVAATRGDDRVASFSNRGDFVDLAAPGESVISTFIAIPRATGADSVGARRPAYSPGLDGTSLSAPMVAGAVALMQAQRRSLGQPPLQPISVMLRLRETADDISAMNPGIDRYGAGRLNVYRALTDPPSSSASRIDATTVGAAVMAPRVAGGKEVAYVTSDQKLLLLLGRSDTLRVVSLPRSPVSQLAATDLGDGHQAGFFVSLNVGMVAGYDGQGTALPGWPVQVPGAPTALTGPALGDLDGDGVLEIVCGASDGRIWAWRADGSVVRGFPVTTDAGGITGSVALSDLDGAPGVEIVASTGLGDVHVIRGDGSEMPGWPVTAGAPITSPVVARLGTTETAVVVGAAGYLKAFAPNGKMLFSPSLTDPPGGVAAQDPALGDLDGDGVDEIVVATDTPTTVTVVDSAGRALGSRGWPYMLGGRAVGPLVIGHLGGPHLGPPRSEILLMQVHDLIALTDSAQVLPLFPKPGGAGITSTVAELDVPGTNEVLAGTGPDSMLYVYNAAIGSALAGPSPWFTPRGNFARTGSRVYAPPLSALDFAPPTPVTDLAADSIGYSSIRLTWRAPGDDGPLGRASAYELRRAKFPLDPQNFASGDSLTGLPAPAAPGTVQSYRATGLEENLTYYFALKSRDAVGNQSGVSNPLSVTSGVSAPGRIIDLSAGTATDSSVELRWTATGDDGTLGRPVRYLVRASLETIDEARFESALKDSLPATQDPGHPEVFVFKGLERARTYFFAIKARDDAGNLSGLSNVIPARTEVGGPLKGRRGPAIASRVQPSRLPVEIYWQGGPQAAQQFIRIYDAAGRLLRTLEVGSEADGVAQWNGRDDRGRLVPAGLYFARLISGSFQAHTRIALLP